MGYYVFVISRDKDPTNGSLTTADAILAYWAARGQWPLNRSTRHQTALRAGDQILFYVSGQSDPQSTHFIARAEVAGSRVLSRGRTGTLKSWTGLLAAPVFDVPIHSVIPWEDPVALRPLIPRLAFIRKKDNWGSYFHGGIVRIGQADFEIITSAYRDGGRLIR
jgi:hypothetical protein